MFESCYRHRYSAVGIIGPSAEVFSSLQSQKSNLIILIDNASRALPKNSSDDPASRHGLQTFLVSISPTTELKEIFQDLKTSQWWNHMATFLIIYRPTILNHGCSKAVEILWLAWKMNLLNAKFICHHESKGPLIYSYNPYTNQAPISWQVEKTHIIENEHPWTLLVRSYQDSQEICNDLEFDQTKDLGGYEIRFHLVLSEIENNTLHNAIVNVMDVKNIAIICIVDALRASFTVSFDQTTEDLIFINDLGASDIIMIPSIRNIQLHNIYHRLIYPPWYPELAFITQHRGNLSQIEKLLRVINYSSRFAVVLVCFITFVLFKFFFRQSVLSAILNVVRLICNAAVPNLPNNVVTRIYLSGLFIFVMTLQGIYQGKLASLSTKPVTLPNVETFEDLENFNYTIYGKHEVADFFEKWNNSGRVVSINGYSCTKYVLKDDSAACVGDRRYFAYIANKYDLHLSATKISISFAYFMRPDWPLQKRMNIMFSRLAQSNIIEYISMKEGGFIFNGEKFHVEEKENQGFTHIALKDLLFAFAILGIGLAGATIVVFVEVWKGTK